MLSPVGSLVAAVLKDMGPDNDTSLFIDGAQRAALLRGLFENYYGALPPDTAVFDSNRAWTGRLDLLARLFPDCRVICCVRSVPWIIDSLGNRTFFAESGVVALHAGPAGGPDADPAARTHADFCRPFHGGGALVEVVRAQMRRRAEALGWRRVAGETWAGVHLEVDGRVVRPRTRGRSACFEIPAAARELWLCSPTSVPRAMGESEDDRVLGLCLAALRFDDGLGVTQVGPDDPRLEAGFYAPEPGRRWTAGRARLPAGLEGTVLLRLDLAGARVPRWIAPPLAADPPADAAQAELWTVSAGGPSMGRGVRPSGSEAARQWDDPAGPDLRHSPATGRVHDPCGRKGQGKRHVAAALGSAAAPHRRRDGPRLPAALSWSGPSATGDAPPRTHRPLGGPDAAVDAPSREVPPPRRHMRPAPGPRS